MESEQCFLGRFRCAVPCVVLIVRQWVIAQPLPVVLRVVFGAFPVVERDGVAVLLRWVLATG
jgi:hypothetical protein